MLLKKIEHQREATHTPSLESRRSLSLSPRVVRGPGGVTPPRSRSGFRDGIERVKVAEDY